MEATTLDALRSWFDSYVIPFRDTDPEGLRNIDLKVEHTARVCEVMDVLTAEEGLSPNECRIAAAAALLHDVGRFPQYRRWRTFRDSISDNHARLSVEVIRSEKLLDEVPDSERLLVEEAVRLHNQRQLPVKVSSPTRLFMQLLRDADKLDIWRVFLDQAILPKAEQASAATLGLPDNPGLTPVCMDAFRNGQLVRLEQCRVVNDFKLMQLSWVHELGFRASRRLVLKREYLPRIAATMYEPGDIHGCLKQFLEDVGQLAA